MIRRCAPGDADTTAVSENGAVIEFNSALARLKRLHANATAGRWEATTVMTVGEVVDELHNVIAKTKHSQDAEFIAGAHAAIPLLLEVADWRKEEERV